MKLNLTIIILLIFSLSYSIVLEERLYRETDKEGDYESHWKLEKLGDTLLRTYTGNDEIQISKIDKNNNTESYERKNINESTAITAVRNGNEIEIIGTFEGREINQVEEIDDLPWCQSLSVSLGDFLLTEKCEYKFWVLRPDNLNTYKLVASKESIDQISVNGEELDAYKIVVRPTGMARNLWKGIYWFDAENKVFVKYETALIIPGVFKKSIELIN